MTRHLNHSEKWFGKMPQLCVDLLSIFTLQLTLATKWKSMCNDYKQSYLLGAFYRTNKKSLLLSYIPNKWVAFFFTFPFHFLPSFQDILFCRPYVFQTNEIIHCEIVEYAWTKALTRQTHWQYRFNGPA